MAQWVTTDALNAEGKTTVVRNPPYLFYPVWRIGTQSDFGAHRRALVQQVG